MLRLLPQQGMYHLFLYVHVPMKHHQQFAVIIRGSVERPGLRLALCNHESSDAGSVVVAQGEVYANGSTLSVSNLK